jgi:hypothetical protein
MLQNPTMATARKIHQNLRDKISRGEPVTVAMGPDSDSFRTLPLHKIAEEAGIDDNDPLLVRALEAQEKATDRRTSPMSWLDLEDAVLDFIEARFEIEDGFTLVIDELLQKLESSEATTTETEQFRRLADEVLRKWDSESWSPKFKERIESALSLLPATDPGIPNNKL